MEVPERPGSEELQFESTMQEFDRTLLSPRAQEMCENSDVVWMTTSKGTQCISLDKMLIQPRN